VRRFIEYCRPQILSEYPIANAEMMSNQCQLGSGCYYIPSNACGTDGNLIEKSEMATGKIVNFFLKTKRTRIISYTFEKIAAFVSFF
jgi:hypothetical protein